uniref:Serine/threonine-protein phosphatase 2A 55 kDa regulatory subunit B n=1 Tax=Timema shepardi TaxID=629360 RepID=A0A7R9FZI4_TIMSH|nr:unnamed protein product [Timema shepardi]
MVPGIGKVELEEVTPHLHGGRVENHLGKTTPVHPTEIRTSISPSSAVELNTTSANERTVPEIFEIIESLSRQSGREREINVSRKNLEIRESRTPRAIRRSVAPSSTLFPPQVWPSPASIIHHAPDLGVWGIPPAPAPTPCLYGGGGYFSRGKTLPSETCKQMVKSAAMIRQSSLTKLGVMLNTAVNSKRYSNGGDTQWCFSQVKGTLDDDVTEGKSQISPQPVKSDIISCVEFNHDGDLLATGDKGGRVVIFQRDPISKNCIPRRGEYNVYSTFQSHEPEFDYLKSLEIEEKINKIRWLKRKNQAHFLLSTNDKTIKLWKVSERDKRVEGYNTKEENGQMRDPLAVTSLRHCTSDIVDIKPTNMEELTEVITAAEFHPVECNLFVYSSSKGTIRLCDMRSAALCDRHSKLFEEPEDPTNRSFFSEIISSISDVKLSNSGRYMISRDYLSVKVWDLHMETKPIESYPVHEYLRSKLCSLYENDCIFDKFECCWNGNDSAIMTGSYNNFFRMFDRTTRRDITLEASREIAKPKTVLKPRKVCSGGKRKKDEISVDCLDFNKKILHTAWHPTENIIAVAATNNLFIFQDKF